MPVEYLDSTNFSKAVAFLVAREASKAGDFGRIVEHEFCNTFGNGPLRFSLADHGSMSDSAIWHQPISRDL